MQLTLKDLNPLYFARRVARGLHRIRMRPVFRRHSEQLKRLKDRHAGARCFLIGNGPSLSQMDLAPLKDEITFGVNAIFLNYHRMGFRPTYYTVGDAVTAEDRGAEINSLTGSTKFIPHDLAYRLKPAPDLIYINYNRRHNVFPSFSRDASEVIYWGSTTMYICMQLAYHMGIKAVYLIGVDHSYTIPDHARGPNITSRGDDPNHFSPDYCGKGLRWHSPRFDRMEAAFRLAREDFQADGRRIINATVGGKLEIFPRQDYESVVGRTEERDLKERDPR